MASPIPTTAYQGLVRPQGSQLLELCSHRPPIFLDGNKTDAKSKSTHDNPCENFGVYLRSYRVQTGTSCQIVQKKSEKQVKWSIQREPNLKTSQ